MSYLKQCKETFSSFKDLKYRDCLVYLKAESPHITMVHEHINRQLADKLPHMNCCVIADSMYASKQPKMQDGLI